MELNEQTKLEILCAYLPYGVEVKWGADTANLIGLIRNAVILNGVFWKESQKKSTENINIILRHPDDMTEEELQKLADITDGVDIMLGVTWQKFLISLETAQKALNYLHSIHVDTFGAIEAGWAIRKEVNNV